VLRVARPHGAPAAVFRSPARRQLRAGNTHHGEPPLRGATLKIG
jgi:hypothetical protein